MRRTPLRPPPRAAGPRTRARSTESAVAATREPGSAPEWARRARRPCCLGRRLPDGRRVACELPAFRPERGGGADDPEPLAQIGALAAKARRAVFGGDRGYRPSRGRVRAAASARAEEADRTAHRLLLEVANLPDEGVETHQGLARALTERGVRTARG